MPTQLTPSQTANKPALYVKGKAAPKRRLFCSGFFLFKLRLLGSYLLILLQDQEQTQIENAVLL